MVFLGSSCKETAKNAIKKKSKGKDDRISPPPHLFRPKVFDMDFPKKVFYGVFLTPLVEKRTKNAIKKISKS
jgi:hypothetical protein